MTNVNRKPHLATMAVLAAALWTLSDPGAKGAEPMTYRHIRVTERDGKVAEIEAMPAEKTPRWAADVSQEPYNWAAHKTPADRPYFEGPVPFVMPPEEGSGEPFDKHNHQPAITWLPNGDLLAIYYTCQWEQGLELTVVASRLRAGQEAWDPASEFFKAPERNMHGCDVLHDGKGKVYHFNGMGREGVGGWIDLAMVMRTSTDNGVTWTPARTFSDGATYRNGHVVTATSLSMSDGTLLVGCDNQKKVFGNPRTTVAHISRDGGKTWARGGEVHGIHASVTELEDGRLMGFGRHWHSKWSISEDQGKSWAYEWTKSKERPAGSGQRPVLLRLDEGPILLVSFTDGRRKPTEKGMKFVARNGDEFTGYGMYAALSFDEGKTWPTRKLLTPGRGTYNGHGHTHKFTATPTRAEHAGYLAGMQTPDNVIHLISSGLHYRFNLAWLKEPNEGPPLDGR